MSIEQDGSANAAVIVSQKAANFNLIMQPTVDNTCPLPSQTIIHHFPLLNDNFYAYLGPFIYQIGYVPLRNTFILFLREATVQLYFTIPKALWALSVPGRVLLGCFPYGSNYPDDRLPVKEAEASSVLLHPPKALPPCQRLSLHKIGLSCELVFYSVATTQIV